MKSIIRFFAQRHLLANLLTFIIIVMGVSSLMSIKRDMFPSIDLDMMMITTRYPGASPEDVELNVTNKIEDELKGVDGLDQMTSYSLENISVINLSLDVNAKDKEKVKRDVRDAVGRVSSFPVEVTDSPHILEIKSENFEVIYVGIAGDVPYKELRDYSQLFEKRLKELDGVSRVEKTGYRGREIEVEISQDAIDKYEIPMREIVSAIQLRNIRSTGGSFESYTSDKNIVAMAQFKDPLEVGDVIVRSTFEGKRILISDIATINDAFEPAKTRFRMNGKEVIAFKVFKNSSADVIRVVDKVKKFVEEEKELMPADIEAMYSSDMSRFVKSRIGVLTNNAVIGLILVLIVLFIFLNFRTAFWVAMGIPLTLLGVFIVAPYFDVYIDLITMMGLILVIGLIVDDAIVVAESIAFRLEKGDQPVDAAVNGAYSVIRPVFATIVTSIMAFGTMFSMTGMMGKFIFSIPLVIILALVISLGEVIIILPAHITAGKIKKRDPGKKDRHEWFNKVRLRFQRFTVYMLAYRYLVLAVFLAMMITAFWYAGNYMQFVMFPGDTADQFYVTIELPTGSSLQATTDKIIEIEAVMEELPEEELDSYWTLIGSLGGGEWMTPGESENWAFMYVTLTPFSQRDRMAEEIVEELKTQISALGGIDEFNVIVDGGGPPVGRPIAIRVVGSDDEMRRALTDSVVAFIGTIDGTSDISRDDKLGKEQMEIIIDYGRLSQLGLTVADIAQNVRLAYDGMVVTRVRYGNEDVGFRVILEEGIRTKPGYLGNLKIPNFQGRLIELKEVATFEVSPAQASFFHYKGERSVTVSADLAQGGELTPLDASNLILENFDLTRDWPGMQFVMGGEAEEQVESMISLAKALLMAGVGIYIVLVLLFNSMTQPILVMFAIPFGMVGIIGAFALHGEPLGFLASMGIIGMMGVVVNDSLILVNFINVHRQEQPDSIFLRIIAEGTAGRLRPILLTSITTVAGLLPTAYGMGGDDPFIAVMALALGYGILFATPLTLILLPCLYMIQHDIGILVRKIPGMSHFHFIPKDAGLEDAAD